MSKVAAALLASLLALVLVTAVAAQGPTEGEVPGTGRAADSPNGVYVPESMSSGFRTLVGGYTGLLNQVAGREPAFRDVLQDIIASNGQDVPPPVTSWSQVVDQLFGVFDLAYKEYQQLVVPAANESTGANSASSSGSTIGSPLDYAPQDALSDRAPDAKSLFLVGLVGLVALMGLGGMTLTAWHIPRV